MITLAEIRFALAAIMRLARGDAAALQAFDVARAGMIRSFYAALVAAPFYAILVVTRLDGTEGIELSPRNLIIETIAYVMGWTAFPLAAYYMIRALDRLDRFDLFITAYNWSNLALTLVYVPIAVIVGNDLLPGIIGSTLGIATMLAMIYFQWFIARAALGIAPLPAAGIIALDVALALTINGWAMALQTAAPPAS